MPFEIHTPPWTNFHELNLDFILNKIKELDARVGIESSIGSYARQRALNITPATITMDGHGAASLDFSGDFESYNVGEENVFEDSDNGFIKVNKTGVYEMDLTIQIVSGGDATRYLSTTPIVGNANGTHQLDYSYIDYNPGYYNLSRTLYLEAGDVVDWRIATNGTVKYFLGCWTITLVSER